MEPFSIFPYQRAFLPDLKDWVHKKSYEGTIPTCIIFPNKRAQRYFYNLYAGDQKAAVLPQIYSFEEIAKLWCANAGYAPCRMASALDQAAILEECVASIAKKNKQIAKKFARMEISEFLPWGLKLADLLEEIFVQGRKGIDIANLEYQVSDPAASLLGSLGEIEREYCRRLKKLNWTTPGFMQFMAAENARHIPPAVFPSAGKLVILAGFSSPAGCEETIYKSLWQAGAHICLHTDAQIAAKNKFHPAYSEQAAWLARWRASAELAVSEQKKTQKDKDAPAIRFFSGYDIHSQLYELNSEIKKNKNLSTAIILANKSAIMPLINDLGEKNINISMGYPINRSSFYRLLEAIFMPLENNMGDGRHYWKHLHGILNHPFIHMLCGADEDGNPLYLKDTIYKISQLLHRGPARISPDEFFQDAVILAEPGVRQLLQNCMEITLNEPAKINSFSSLADYLIKLRNFLMQHGQLIWEKSPLDAEVIYRLSNNIIPALKNNLLAEKELFFPLVLSYFRRLSETENIPFAVEKLDNIQIMGLLETRLLNFDRVFFIDVTDDKLPGSLPHDSLLPNSLRGVLGLPDNKKREKDVAYNIFRLAMGAKEAHYYWQESVTHSEVRDGKKRRSRFVEQLLWQEEKNSLKKILEPGMENYHVAKAPVTITQRLPKSLAAEGELGARLDEFFSRPISSTELQSYLACPLIFAYKYLLNIRPSSRVTEGDNPLLAGKVVHEALKNLLSEFRNKIIDKNYLIANKKKLLEDSFNIAVKIHSPQKFLPAHSFIKLEISYFKYIGEYLDKFPEQVFLKDLEAENAAAIEFAGKKYALTGRVDRIEERDKKLKIIDYKTGGDTVIDTSFWQDEKFFDAACEYCLEEKNYEGLTASLEKIRLSMPSLQLPFYLTILAANGIYGAPDNAAYVVLGKNDEHWLFDDKEMTSSQHEKALLNCKIAIMLVIEHIKRTPAFTGRFSSACIYCPYQGMCSC